MEVEVENERHALRFMVKLLIFVGLLYATGRFLAQQKEQWAGLTESQAKAKVEAKLSSRIGEEKASEIATQVIAALTEAGVIKADESPVAEDIADVAEDVVAKAEEIIEKAEEEAE
jgi:DNA-directed RNA polymerase specialized sigma54-like protein